MDIFGSFSFRYQLLNGVTELESYHDFGVIELDHGILDNQRDDFIKKYAKVVFEGAEEESRKEILKQYSPSKLDPQRWNVETNRDVILHVFSDARTLAPMISFANYQARANTQSYFYVFAHNSVSTDYAPLNKSVHGEEMPYVLGIPLGGATTHFHSDYTKEEKLLSEVIMRLWTNFVKNGSPNTQSVNEYQTFDRKHWSRYNVEWPEYNVAHQPYLRIDMPPSIKSLYRSNYTNFWIDTLPKKMKRYMIDPLFEFTVPTTSKPKPTHKVTEPIRKTWAPHASAPSYGSSGYSSPHFSSASAFGKLRPYSPPQPKPDTDMIYREIQSIKTPSRPISPNVVEKISTTQKPTTVNMTVKTSGATITLIVSLSILFIFANVGICTMLYYKKRKARERERHIDSRSPRPEIGEIDLIGQKSAKDDKSALKTFKNGYSVIKSMSMGKMRNNSKKIKKKDGSKTPKSDDSGGFRERFQLRRHLSTSTLDAHTKVRDWITNEVMHRCSPSILRKSNTELNSKAYIKPFTRSEELLSDSKKTNTNIDIDNTLITKNLLAYSAKNKTSEKTTSTSALDSLSLSSNKRSTLDKSTRKSSDSIKSKGNDSIKSKKVSVAVDATPAARTNSILKQEPIENIKSIDSEIKHSDSVELQRIDIPNQIDNSNKKPSNEEIKTYTNEVTLSLERKKPLKILHKHSCSDPVTDVNYEQLMKEKMSEIIDILPPVTFRNDVNVTSRDEKTQESLSAEEALQTIKRRNFPKVLPDLPKAQKRLSLQPTTLQSFRSFESQVDRPKVPPQPPPRTTTLERRLAYKNTKPLSSFDVSNIKKIRESDSNYENIDKLSDYSEINKFKSLDTNLGEGDKIQSREYPKIIIASSTVQNTEPKIIIKPSRPLEIPAVIPHVRLPDDFHTHAGSTTSFTSIYSDEDNDDFLDDLAEDKLIQELVGGLDSPTDIDELDSKGPETIFEKKMEIVPVKINMNEGPKHKDYICVSDLLIPDISGIEPTAQIKPNFGLNKLKNRSESIHRPPEKAIKVKQKRVKPPALIKNAKPGASGSFKCKSDNQLEHSNSGSSNDTETSTGTVRRVDLK